MMDELFDIFNAKLASTIDNHANHGEAEYLMKNLCEAIQEYLEEKDESIQTP